MNPSSYSAHLRTKENFATLVILVSHTVLTNFGSAKGRSEIKKWRLGMVNYACHPSYSGGRNQEDPSSRPAQAKKLTRLYLNQQASLSGKCLWSQLLGKHRREDQHQAKT
jgi:hypothetical protein